MGLNPLALVEVSILTLSPTSPATFVAPVATLSVALDALSAHFTVALLPPSLFVLPALDVIVVGRRSLSF